jgi:hypothetical protein
VEHILDETAETPTTLCGMDASSMARWSAGEAGPDSVIRPTCAACRTIAQELRSK